MLGILSRETPLETRITTYRSANLVQLAMAEGGAAIGITEYFMGNNMLGIVVAVSMIGWMVMLRPTADRIMQEAHISSSELEEA